MKRLSVLLLVCTSLFVCGCATFSPDSLRIPIDNGFGVLQPSGSNGNLTNDAATLSDCDRV